jgi:hypothetical protein
MARYLHCHHDIQRGGRLGILAGHPAFVEDDVWTVCCRRDSPPTSGLPESNQNSDSAAAGLVLRFPEQGERGFQPKMNSPSEAT